MRGRDIGVYVICRDRFGCLVGLVDWLVAAGHENIVLVDNASTYPPLIDWYKTCGHAVVRLEENVGHLAPFELGMVPPDKPYVVTDCDVVPTAGCPADAVDHLLDVLLSYDVTKVGLGLEIGDLPETPMAKAARLLEHRFWIASAGPGLLDAAVDTTFAIYRPGIPFEVDGVRTAPPYLARHVTWYLGQGGLPEDEQWYLDHMEGTRGYSGNY